MTISKTCKIVAVIFIALFVLIYMGIAMRKVNVTDISGAMITFVYCDTNINEKLTSEEAEILKNIVNGKRLGLGGGFSCGFTPDISFRFVNMFFLPANDTCEIIKVEKQYKNGKRKDSDIYILITEEEKQKIYDIFKKYGGYFPCV
ncbi:MAG: hypothetical protein FWG50_11895 [Kiritimatiellaeota bacterium]|nr:hypothetical protein [Kiritimatiellota bacterium]